MLILALLGVVGTRREKLGTDGEILTRDISITGEPLGMFTAPKTLSTKHVLRGDETGVQEGAFKCVKFGWWERRLD